MSTKTRKIEGFAFMGDRETAIIFSPTNGPGAFPATLVIGGKAFSEEEVKAILDEFETYGGLNEWQREIIAKHGITL